MKIKTNKYKINKNINKEQQEININKTQLKNRQEIYNSKTAGITLIALVITIIVLLILAGITLNITLGENGLIRKAEEADFKAKMADIAEAWELYKGDQELKNRGLGEYVNIEEIYAGELLKQIIIDEELDITEDQVQDIKKLIEKVTKKEEKYVIIHEGELYYVSQPNIPNNKNQTKWCEEIGIKIWEYIPQNAGIKDVTGGYENINGMYMCTPILTKGWVKEKTRYIKEKEGYLVPGNWITRKPDEDWYDYKEHKWANIYVESSGLEGYYIWIPRYVYRLSGNERTDVKFVDINNNYIDGETGRETSWGELQRQGYKIPEAFYYGDNEDYKQNTAIPGYWISKYQLSELADEDTYTIDFSTAATVSTITIQNIVVNNTAVEATGRKIAKYVYAVNGNIVHESTQPEDFKLTGLARGNKAINVTIVDENGEIIGSMTKLYEVADVNPPDLTGFDPDTTFYVYWDEEGKEHNEVPISKPEPPEWYDYTTKAWANIVTRNNGLETYLVWIPRYQYALDTVSQRTYVKFIKGLGTQTDTGYKIPEAFSWGDNNNVPISGYWISKYQLTDGGALAMTAEILAGGNTIQIKDITGTKIRDGLKYEYYLNGVKVHEGTDAKENYKYSNLEKNKTYTVNIIARDANTNEYVAATTRKLETVGANAPVLVGFNENNTYYVLYDEAGNMRIGDKIKNDGSNMPEDWYEYSERRWANIVVTDGKVENGEIKEATSTTYLVWVPRYQYSLDTTNQRTNVKFIDGVDTKVEAGYKIPEAFSWGDSNNVPIPGYWITKYQLSN